jgi:polar amino acid transport system substrate-binding protein
LKRVALGLAMLATTGIAVAGCGSSSSGSGDNPTVGTTSTAQAADACTPSQLKTVSPGNITIGVDQPVYPPWFNDNKTPIDGKGFESAVDLAIAKALGYTPAQIKLKRITFNQAIGPGASGFDYDLDEFTITKAREKVVDFSVPYYEVAEAVLAMKGTPAASVSTFAGLKSLKLGAQTGSTDAETIQNVIKPSKTPSLFGTNGLAVQALKNHQIDGLVVDLPTAFYITSAQVSGSTIVGQLPPAANPESFGALLKKGSPLTDCVDKAVLALQTSGTLSTIQDKWLAKAGDAPVLP